MKNKFTLFLTCLTLAGIVACKKKDDTMTPTVSATTGASIETQFLTNYANIAFSSFTEAKTYAAALNTAINNFTSAPTAVNFDACKDAYKFARLSYLQTEVFRGVNGPIDSEDGAPESWIWTKHILTMCSLAIKTQIQTK